MSRFLILACAALATAACANSATSSSTNAFEQPNIVGGWSPIAVDHPDVKAATAFVAKYYAESGVSITKVNKADTQVVAGTNYRLSLTLSNGRQPNVVVWKKLDGSMEIIAIADQK